MERKIRVGAVSYLNTKPLVYGLSQSPIADKIELSFEYPALLAQQLLNDEIDLGLVPVAALVDLPNAHILPTVCIGATGEVASVCLFGEVPIGKMEIIYLDYQSRTSVALLKVLLKKYWKISPQLIQAEEGYQEHIIGKTGGLVIGDRAFLQKKISKYRYDLATAWLQHTGLPFVFAAWVSNKKLPTDFVNEFVRASAEGLNHLEKIVADNYIADYDLMTYYTKNISYGFDDAKMQGLNLFLKQLHQQDA